MGVAEGANAYQRRGLQLGTLELTLAAGLLATGSLVDRLPPNLVIAAAALILVEPLVLLTRTTAGELLDERGRPNRALGWRAAIIGIATGMALGTTVVAAGFLGGAALAVLVVALTATGVHRIGLRSKELGTLGPTMPPEVMVRIAIFIAAGGAGHVLGGELTGAPPPGALAPAAVGELLFAGFLYYGACGAMGIHFARRARTGRDAHVLPASSRTDAAPTTATSRLTRPGVPDVTPGLIASAQHSVAALSGFALTAAFVLIWTRGIGPLTVLDLLDLSLVEFLVVFVPMFPTFMLLRKERAWLDLAVTWTFTLLMAAFLVVYAIKSGGAPVTLLAAPLLLLHVGQIWGARHQSDGFERGMQRILLGFILLLGGIVFAGVGLTWPDLALSTETIRDAAAARGTTFGGPRAEHVFLVAFGFMVAVQAYAAVRGLAGRPAVPAFAYGATEDTFPATSTEPVVLP